VHTRNEYLDRIDPFLGKPVIKVITGLRRSGKSCFLRQIVQRLQERHGAVAADMILVDKESLEFQDLRTAQDLNAFVRQRRPKCKGKPCLLVDEVQEIAEWEKAIVSLAKPGDMDIVITGSNAHMLSSELATLLSGRYIEFPIQTLSFPEFMEFRADKAGSAEDEFGLYLRYGGFPALHLFDLLDETVYQYVSAVYSTILLKDIVRRYDIRNVPLLENIGRYLFDNIGNLVSANRIAMYLRSQRLRIGVETVQAYIGHFADAQLFSKVSRFDIEGKRHLEINDKYYLNELGLRHAILGFREGDIGAFLENLVFLDLKRRGYRVSVGKLGTAEVDFVATRERERIYVQVAYLLERPETVDRETRPLMAIEDNYPKYLVTLDRHFGNDIKGIRRLHAQDFLLRRD
jgi:predicted AAA+ superfamily ATPase